MIPEVYEAFIAAGVSRDKAFSAENLATKADIRRIGKELLLLKWMVGFNLAFTMTILWKIFF